MAETVLLKNIFTLRLVAITTAYLEVSELDKTDIEITAACELCVKSSIYTAEVEGQA